MDIRVNNTYSVSTVKPIKRTNLNFRGELETKFFEAVRKGNKNESIKLLNNIKFDVLEKDVINSNNFLHVICIEKAPTFFAKAVKLLKSNIDKIQDVLSMKNKENKVPFDYLEDDLKGNEFKNLIYSLVAKPESDTLQPQSGVDVGNIAKATTVIGATAVATVLPLKTFLMLTTFPFNPTNVIVCFLTATSITSVVPSV